MKRYLVKESQFGAIFFGYDSTLAKNVAIKECDLKSMDEGVNKNNRNKVAEDPKQEIKLHRQLNDNKKGKKHPGIIQIYDIFEDEKNLNLVLEWADKGDLFDFVLDHHQIPESLSDKKVIESWQEEIQKIFYIMCSAVKFMHEKNIVHR